MVSYKQTLFTSLLLLGASFSMSAATITSLGFTGNAANPTITITGTGFLPVPPVSSPSAGGAFTGQDYGNQLYIMDAPVSGPFTAFQAGYDFGGNHDSVGFTNLIYTDTQITFNFGSEYTNVFFPAKTYGVNNGDTFVAVVHGATASATVLFTPEPSTMLLLAAGALPFVALRRRRAARS